MNYLKKFESFQTHDEIHEICKQYKIKNYTINSDGSIDVNGDVDLNFKMLKKLPLKFNHVSGDFACSNNELTTLEGAPQSVDSYFHCDNNELTTLEGAPQSVGGTFYCSNNKLTTLEGAPQSVSYFYCSNNKLTTLEGAPQFVGGVFDCYRNRLTTLEGGPQSVDLDFNCSDNFLTTLEGAPQSVGTHFICAGNYLTTLVGSPQYVGGRFNCSVNRLTTLNGAPQSVNAFSCSFNKDLKSLYYIPKNIQNMIIFNDTPVYEIFKILNNFSLDMIKYVNDLKVIVDDKIDLEMLNAILYDEDKPLVENVKGYDII